MTLGTMSNWTDSQVLSGAIVLGPREGVHVRSFASPAADPRVPAAVYHGAQCFLCEWVYRPGFVRVQWEGLDVVACRYESPDVLDVTAWVVAHQCTPTHQRAAEYFRGIETTR